MSLLWRCFVTNIKMAPTHAPASDEKLPSGATATEPVLASLAVISHEKLVSDDDAETEKLLHACATWGFFYLDIGPDSAGSYQSATSDLFRFAKQYFAQPLEDKMKDMNKEWALFNVCGYKPRSLDTGNVEGRKDGCEGLRVSTVPTFN